MNLRDMQESVEATNTAAGWYDKPRTFGEGIALIHSEASEALEAYRVMPEEWPTEFLAGETDPRDPVSEELADIIIRVLDEATRLGVDMQYWVEQKIRKNGERDYRHGGKRL